MGRILFQGFEWRGGGWRDGNGEDFSSGDIYSELKLVNIGYPYGEVKY